MSFLTKLARIAAFLALAGAVATPVAAQEKTLAVFNWSDYIDIRVLDDFTRETGISVSYDTYDSATTLETRLIGGKSGYDIVVPPGTLLPRLIQAGALRKLDKSKLPNLANATPEIAAKLASYDPGNQYAVNYMWVTTGIAYNAKRAKERLGEMSIESWDLLFRPDTVKKFANCGVSLLDSPEDVFVSALRYLRLDPNSRTVTDLERAAAVLERIRPSVRRSQPGDLITGLATGDICLALIWSGDALQAKNRAIEAKNGIDIGYVIPKEGGQLSLDNLAIPADAPHVEEAHRFIDFLLRPDIAARNSNLTNYANGVAASKPLVKDEVRLNPMVWPEADTLKRLYAIVPFDQRVQRITSRIWAKFKAGA